MYCDSCLLKVFKNQPHPATVQARSLSQGLSFRGAWGDFTSGDLHFTPLLQTPGSRLDYRENRLTSLAHCTSAFRLGMSLLELEGAKQLWLFSYLLEGLF